MDLPELGQGRLVLGEAGQVLLQRGDLAVPLAQEHLAIDQVQDRFGILANAREPAEIGLHEDAIARLPAFRLISPHQGQNLHRALGFSTGQISGHDQGRKAGIGLGGRWGIG
jgi:hypothetical protein